MSRDPRWHATDLTVTYGGKFRAMTTDHDTARDIAHAMNRLPVVERQLRASKSRGANNRRTLAKQRHQQENQP